MGVKIRVVFNVFNESRYRLPFAHLFLCHAGIEHVTLNHSRSCIVLFKSNICRCGHLKLHPQYRTGFLLILPPLIALRSSGGFGIETSSYEFR